ncbi:protein S40-4-like [Typha angustifolia]|uniref:protein S40-4-like n=1 Tax=Typha angustifolia TaxID=59011 RepID=UPI003C2C79E9
MAGRTRSLMKNPHRLFTPAPESAGPIRFGSDEFDESDIWGCPVEPRPAETRKPVPARSGRKKTDKLDRGSGPASLPVNIPDWSEILRGEYVGKPNNDWEVEDDEDDESGEVTGVVIPPHELLYRNRTASFSVHEGVGRTLKGRDLRRVRNAIWEKIGFQD